MANNVALAQRDLSRHAVAIGVGLPNVAEETLRFYRQIGVEAASIPTRYVTRVRRRRLVPPTQHGPRGSQPEPWDEAEIERITARVETFGLVPLGVNLPLSGSILMGRPGRDADIEKVSACVRTAGRVGIGVATYSFTALRASEGYSLRRGRGRGGSSLRDFCYDRIGHLPPLEGVGRHSMGEMWEHLAYFLQTVVPVAEEAGVRLAAHPNDPPVPEYRGVAQPLGDLEGLRRLIDLVDSSSNCLFLDTGVITELGEDAVQAIHWFGERNRIATVHFRNVHVEVPRYEYVETFIDEGDCDMMACMTALQKVGYRGMVDPDHTPGITADTPERRIGWAFAIGHMIALRNAAETEVEGST